MIDPGRILPKWSQFNPEESLNRIVDFDYGISDGQKKRILDCLLGESHAVKAVDQENWSQGEHDFFWDKCTELGYDPDYCVEDVEEDDSGSAQFISQLAKTAKLGTTGWKVAVLSVVTMGIAVLIFWGLHYVFGLAAVSRVTLPQTGPYFQLGPGFGMGLLLSQLWHPGFLHVFDYLSPALGPGMLIHAQTFWWSAFNLIGLGVHLSNGSFIWIGPVLWLFGSIGQLQSRVLFFGVLSLSVSDWSGLSLLRWAVKRYWRVLPNCLAQFSFSLGNGHSPVNQAQVNCDPFVFSAGVNWSWNDRPNVQYLCLEIFRPNAVLLYRPNAVLLYRPNDMSASFGPHPNCSICSIMKAQFWVACFGKSNLSLGGLILVHPLSTSRIHVWQAQFNWVFPGFLAAEFWAWAHYFCCYRWMLKARSWVLLLFCTIRVPLKEYNGPLLDKDVYLLAICCNRLGCLVLINSFPRVLLGKHIIPTRMLNVSRCCMFFFVFSNTKACFGISLLDGGGMPL
ncbi:hypothetical protein Hanom_Chr15g01337511 [Helianthus anomalus]